MVGFVALEPGKGKHSGCGGDRTAAQAELIAGLVVIQAPENAPHGLDKRAPDGILKNKDFFKLHQHLDEGGEALWFHVSAVGRAGCGW